MTRGMRPGSPTRWQSGAGPGKASGLLPLPAPSAAAGPLLAYITARTDGKARTFLFQNRTGGPMHRRTVERLTAIWGRKAGVPNCIPHRLRHSFGTTLLRQTRDIKAVQEALGHEDIGSTMGYVALSNERLAEAIGSLSWTPVIATSEGSGYVSPRPDPKMDPQSPAN